MYIILNPYLDDVLVLFIGMYGGRREGIHEPYRMATPHVIYVSYFRENIGQTMFVSYDLLSSYEMNYLYLMRNFVQQVMEGWFGENLAQGGRLTHVCVTNVGGDELQHSPYQLLEDKQHLGGEDYNIPN